MMKKIRPLTLKQIEFLYKAVDGTWTFGETTGRVDVNGNVYINKTYYKSSTNGRYGRWRGNRYRTLHVPFNHVEGNFLVGWVQDCTKSFDNFPRTVSGNCECRHFTVEDWVNAPVLVEGDFDFSGSQIRSFKGFNTQVKGILKMNHMEEFEATMEEVKVVLKIVGDIEYCGNGYTTYGGKYIGTKQNKALALIMKLKEKRAK